ncbi:hypothetical protein [Actinocrinis sp.]|uniref:hypothetical protein n=1 Tax=Actinocrinis sp. TaxID=1920516 RepID=UPI002CE54623|nr:hypothetical protein [Actinocrinis sp.]HXR70061.1 hypothetical protein [Actinocrinis sp.]
MTPLRGRGLVVLSTALCCLLILLAPAVRIIQDPAGLWLIIGAPTCVYYGTARRVVSTPDGAALLAFGFTILHDLLVLLGLDLVLPLFGDEHPLQLAPITLAFAAVTILVGALTPEAQPVAREPLWWHRRGFGPVLALGALILVLSVAGPIRLNNGFGSAVSITAMVVIVAALLFLLFKQRYSVGAIELGIYFAAAGILLLTSLRGWLITGHDVQTEFAYYSDVLASGRWEPGHVHNAYYACLSVTLFPVSFAHLTAISDVYIFKVVEPLLFAVTPVLLFRGVRNVASHQVAMLSAIFFIIFPTFSTDMTYMSRQEIAFILVGCATLLVTERATAPLARRIAFGALMVGVVLSHYSTAYIVIIICGIAVVADLALRLWSRLRRRAHESGGRPRRVPRIGGQATAALVPWWLVVFAAAAAFLWAGPVTHTDSQVQSTLSAAISQLEGNASSGLFATKQTSTQLLSGYQKSAVTATAKDRAKGVYWPLSAVDEYPITTVGTQYQPLTGTGRRLQQAGIGVTGANVLARSIDDRTYELLIIAGLAGVWFAGRRLFTPLKDQVLLSVGALGMLGVLTVVPQLSVDYGILRAFQEGMYFFAPFMAAGLIWICGLLKRWARPAAAVVVAVIASTMTGVVPQLTGGYLGILSMSNEGQYYNIHYPTDSERTGAQWLNAMALAQKRKSGTAPVLQTDFYTYDTMQTVFTNPVLPDLLPQWLRPGGYQFVGQTMLRTGRVSIRINGQIVTYTYPPQLLDTQYNKIYASDGAEVYGPEMNN